ncbi:MAG: lipopolysaccharide biosynthesis protein [Acidobacteria bacterium]|nr:MAG: lipopolysaccharide biosynthesis protein [Acidobacteriota bacterium]
MTESALEAGNLRAKSARGLVWAAAEKWGVQLSGLVTLSVLANLLPVRDFGLIAMAGVFLALLNLVSEQGIVSAIIQRREVEDAHLDSAFWANLAVGVILAASAVAASGSVASFYKEPRLGPIIVCLSARFLVQPFSVVPQALLARGLQFRETALRSLVSRVLGGVVGIVLAFLGWGVWSLVAQDLTGTLAEALVLWRVTSWRPHWRFSLAHFSELFAFGIHVTALGITRFAHYQVAPLLLGLLAGPVALGYYSVGFKMLQALLQVMQGILTTVALPAFARLQTQLARLRLLFYEASSLISLVGFPVYAGIIVAAPELVAVVFGQKWAASIPVLQVLSLSGFVTTMLAPSGPMLMALNKASSLLRLSILGATVSVVLLIAAVPWGIVAVAAAYSGRLFLMAPLHFHIASRVLGIDWRVYFRGLMPSSVGAVSIVAVGFIARALLPDWLGSGGKLASLVILGALAYAIVIWATGPELVKGMRDLVAAALSPGKPELTVDDAAVAVADFGDRPDS